MSYGVIDKSIKVQLMKMVKGLIKAGCYDYASNSFSLDTYSKYEKHYLEFFNNRWLLLYYTVFAWLKYKRRCFITFTDNPLKGKK